MEKIPHYINDPIINAATAPELKLCRPKISFVKAFIYILAHLIVAFLLSLGWVLLENGQMTNLTETIITKITIISLFLFLVTLRFSFIWFVKVYQRYAKSETRLRCCMTPSCSEYAILAFKKYGAILGGIKTWKRLLRCHPPGGVDYP